MLLDNFGKNDKLVNTSVSEDGVSVVAFITAKGKKLLLINQRNKEIKINLPVDVKNETADYVDGRTGENPVAQMKLKDAKVTLKPFSSNGNSVIIFIDLN